MGALGWIYDTINKKWVPVKSSPDGVQEVYDPKVGSLISYDGTTTTDGADDGSTLIDSVLATKPDYNGNLVIITSGDYAGQARNINGVTTGGMVTPASNFGGQIVSGTTFVIVGIRTTPAEVAAIEAKLDHVDHGLAALKTLIDAVEGKLDAGGLGAGLVTKALTFANQTGQVSLFTVTGDVIMRLVAVVKTGCATGTACNVSVGIAADVDAIIPVTDITLLAAQEIWHDATPDSEIEALITLREYIISDGNDITLNSSAADNSGAITFYCFWTALSSGATVVAA